MGVPDFVLVAANAVVASMLVNAGLLKIVSPVPLRDAIAELAPRRAHLLSARSVRIIAGVEVVAGLGLLFPVTRVPAAVLAGGFGVVFAAAGVGGRIRHSSVPCGCLGGSSRQTLGLASVATGAAFAAAAVVNVAVVPPAIGAAVYVRGAAVGTALLMLLQCLWAHRESVHRLSNPERRPVGGEVY
jgi:hypothetical protein